MSSRTLTNTVWGELCVDYQEDGVQLVRATCKVCQGMRTAVLARGENPFRAVMPTHTDECRIARPVTPTS